MAYGVHEPDFKQIGILENLLRNYSTSDKAYNTGRVAGLYLQDSKIYEDRVKESLFKREGKLVADNYNSKSIDNLVTPNYSPVLPKYFSQLMTADNYHIDNKEMYK